MAEHGEQFAPHAVLVAGKVRLGIVASREFGVVDKRLQRTGLRVEAHHVAVMHARDHAAVEGLGPDPLRDDADPERMWARLQRSAKPVGLLLMEQDVVAGVGNVYRSELCNIVGIDPRRPGRKVTREEFDELWRETVRQLRLGVKRNRIVTMRTDELDRPVSRLRRGEGRYVYKQDRCGRCGTELDVFALAGRTTWRCPRCQPR